MSILKSVKFNLILNAVLTILIGLLFVINPYGASSTIAIIAGVIVLCNGIFDMIRYFTADEYFYFVRGSLFTGILKCILGIFIFTHTGAMVALFSYIFSILIIVNGITCMESCFQLKRAGVGSWILNMLLAALVTAAGVVLLFHPFGAAATMAICIGVVLIVDGITELITMQQLKKIGKEFYQTVKDIEDEKNGNIIDE